MRHAFLIIAHNNWWQLKQLILLLNAENHDIYIHIDKKSKDFNQCDFNDIVQSSKVVFLQEYEVFWGGFSQVEVELFLFEKAHEQQYDYYHLISGADLPLKNNQEMDAFFEKNTGKQFIQYDDDKLRNDSEIARRTKYYHFLQNYRRSFSHKWINDCFTFCERVSLVAQIVLRINRVRKLDWEIKYGSNWVSITDELVSVLVAEKIKIKRVFSFTNCADELFVQTVAFNSRFKDQIYQFSKECTANMRYIDWNRGSSGNPYTFRKEDFNVLKNSEMIFARKFSEKVDKEIILEIINSRKEE